MKKKRSSSARQRGRPINAATYDAIIRTAAQLFMAQGLHATTMDHIARNLGISKLTLYSRFENKEALFTAVIEAKCQHYFPEFLFTGLLQRPMEQALELIARGLMQLLLSDDVIAMERLLMAEAESQPHLIQLFYNAGPGRTKALIANLLRHWHIQGDLTVPNPKIATDMFCAMFKGSDMIFRRSMRLSPAPTSREINAYCRAAVRCFIIAHS